MITKFNILYNCCVLFYVRINFSDTVRDLSKICNPYRNPSYGYTYITATGVNRISCRCTHTSCVQASLLKIEVSNMSPDHPVYLLTCAASAEARTTVSLLFFMAS